MNLKQASTQECPFTFDLIAIVDSVNKVESRITKDGVDMPYRDIYLRDEGFKIEMKVWSD